MSHPLGDATRMWMCVRGSIDWTRPVSLSDAPGNGPSKAAARGSGRDGHRHFVEAFVRHRSPREADLRHRALDAVRQDASSEVDLTFERLAAWQSTALGHESGQLPKFRRTDAFGKGGRERYAFCPSTEIMFRECLAQALDCAVPLSARVARTYLDILFFHPFEDGNARSAAFAADFLLARSGAVLEQVGPMYSIRRWADDREGTLSFVRLVTALARRASTLRVSSVGAPEALRTNAGPRLRDSHLEVR